MKSTLRTPTRLLGLGALLVPLLTACPGPLPPPPPPEAPLFNLAFNYPPQADLSGLTLAAYTYSGDSKLTLVNGYGGYYGAYTSPVPVGPVKYNLSSLYVGGYTLDNLLSASGINCKAYRPPADPTQPTLTITPADVQTCLVYFLAFSDTLKQNGKPDLGEEAYMTHDVLSYADKDYGYTGVSADGKITTTGSVKKGWTLLRHSVLQPTATPGQYKVSMTSVPTDDQGIPIQMHEPSNFFTSLSLGGVSTGGTK